MIATLNNIDSRSRWTKWWGLATIVSLPIAYSLIFAGADFTLPVAAAALIVGMIGYFFMIRSAYSAKRRRKSNVILDERQQRVVEHAYNYAYRAIGTVIVLFLFYAYITSKPEHVNMWFPHLPKQWLGLLLPMGMTLTILPTVFAEWLDPAQTDDEGDDG